MGKRSVEQSIKELVNELRKSHLAYLRFRHWVEVFSLLLIVQCVLFSMLFWVLWENSEDKIFFKDEIL